MILPEEVVTDVTSEFTSGEINTICNLRYAISIGQCSVPTLKEERR